MILRKISSYVISVCFNEFTDFVGNFGKYSGSIWYQSICRIHYGCQQAFQIVSLCRRYIRFQACHFVVHLAKWSTFFLSLWRVIRPCLYYECQQSECGQQLLYEMRVSVWLSAIWHWSVHHWLWFQFLLFTRKASGCQRTLHQFAHWFIPYRLFVKNKFIDSLQNIAKKMNRKALNRVQYSQPWH